MNTHLPTLVAVFLLLSACGDCCKDCQEAAWTPVAEDGLDATQKAQRATAFRAKDAMFKELSGALMGAIKESGPAAAINVCRCEAPQIAARVAKAEGVAIGRTAFKLRNPKNLPPSWAAALVEKKHGDNAYVVHPDGRLAALLPIRLQAPCMTCHGDPAKIAEDVKAQIATFYPDDDAMGFAQGDLRGWFWIEVPAPKPE